MLEARCSHTGPQGSVGNLGMKAKIWAKGLYLVCPRGRLPGIVLGGRGLAHLCWSENSDANSVMDVPFGWPEHSPHAPWIPLWPSARSHPCGKKEFYYIYHDHSSGPRLLGLGQSGIHMEGLRGEKALKSCVKRGGESQARRPIPVIPGRDGGRGALFQG